MILEAATASMNYGLSEPNFVSSVSLPHSVSAI